MTEQERIELLKQVADCAPKYMGADFVGPDRLDNQRVEFHINRDGKYCNDSASLDLFDWGKYPESIDYQDAPAIIAMLDAMEKAGLTPALSITAADDAYRYEVAYAQYGKRCDSCGTYGYTHLEFHGATRAEAVARAFVRVFGEQP